MAGLFDTITGGGGLETARASAAERIRRAREQQTQNILQTIRDPKERIGFQIGSAFGAGLAKGIFGDQVDEDPEVVAARESAELARRLAVLGEEFDPQTPEFAFEAAKVAREMNRPEIAVQFGQIGGERQAQQSVLEEKARRQKMQDDREAFDKLPSTVRTTVVVEDPEFLTTRLGMDDETAAAVRDSLQEQMEFKKLKMQKDLDNLRRATVGEVSGADLKRSGALLKNLGVSPDSFNTIWRSLRGKKGTTMNEEDFDKLVTPIAIETQRRMDLARDRGIRASETEVVRDIWGELVTGGAFEVVAGDKGEIEIEDFNSEAMLRILGNAPGTQAAPSPGRPAEGQPQQRRRLDLNIPAQ